MHHDDSIQTVSLAGQRVLTARCDEWGRTADDLGAAWAQADASFLWLSHDGSAPEAAEIEVAPDDAVSATLVPVVDAVKRVDRDGTIVETVDRSTLAGVRPPALIPAEVVERVLAVGGTGMLLDDAIRLAGVVEISPGA